MFDEEPDAIARRLAFAVCEWLASDGNEDSFQTVERLAARWKEAVLRG
jgi:hypothetical protein